MPDTITEFINEEVSYSELQTGVSIVTNTADEQAVVKEVIIESEVNTRPFIVKDGDTTIGSITGEGALTGSELVGESSSVKLFGPTSLLNRFLYCTNVVTPYVLKAIAGATLTGTKSIFEGETGAVLGTHPLTKINGASNLTVTPLFACFGATGNFYYASNTGTMYKRAGGASGAETTQAMSYIGQCYDGERYIYSFTNETTLEIFDTTTDTKTTKTIEAIGTISAAQTSACAIDGFVWVKAQGSDPGALVNAATGVTDPYNSIGLAGGAFKYNCGIGQDLNGNYVIAYGGGTTPYQGYIVIGKDLTTPKLLGRGNFTAVTALESDLLKGTGVCMHRVEENKRYLVSLIGTEARIFDLHKKIMTLFTALGDTAATNAKILYPDATVAAATLGRVAVRATGIKTTL